MTKLPVQAKTQSQQQPNNTTNKSLGVRMSRAEFFSGPLPHPDTLQKYEQICPGAANRIIKMAEGQTNHRQKLESRVVDSNIRNERKGMHYSFILTGGFMLIGGVLLMFDKQAAGYLSLFGPVIFQAGNYGYKKYKEQQVPKKNDKDMENEKKKISRRR